MLSKNFRPCGDSLSVRRIDSRLQALITEAVCLPEDKNREIKQGHLHTYLAEHSLARPMAAAFFDRLLDEHKERAGLGFQESFPILFKPDNIESLNKGLLANMVYVLSKASTEELREKTEANIVLALTLQPDLKKAVENEKIRFKVSPAVAHSAQSTPREGAPSLDC